MSKECPYGRSAQFYLALTIGCLTFSSFGADSQSEANGVQAGTNTVSEVSEGELVDILLGIKEGPKSSGMRLKPEQRMTNQSIGNAFDQSAGVSSPAINGSSAQDSSISQGQSDEYAHKYIIRDFVGDTARTGGLAKGKGKRLLAQRYSISQPEANRLYRWATTMLDDAQEILDSHARSLCISYFDDKDKLGLAETVSDFRIGMLERSAAVDNAWNDAELKLSGAVSHSTYAKATERMDVMKSTMSSGFAVISADSQSIESVKEAKSELLLAVEHTDGFCNHMLSLPE